MTASRRRTIWIAAILLACVAVAVVLVQRHRAAQEASAISELQRLGALVVLDGNRQHAASVNLSMVAGTDQLRQAFLTLPHLRRLASLDASRTAVTDDDLASVGRLPTLTSLTLSQTGVSDEGLRHLTRLRRLEALYLMESRVTRDSLDQLTSLGQLRILDLSHSQVAGDISPLARLPNLEWLLLGGISLDQPALAGLAAAPALRRLTLEGCQYESAWLEPLRAERSDLDIDE